MSGTVLSVNALSYHYGKRLILDNLDIEIKAGEVTALLGPNGAGKSTLLKLLCGEIRNSNEICYFGQHKDSWQPEKLARHIAMLPQHSTLNFPFLAREVVEMGAIPLKTTKTKTQSLAKKYMQLTDCAHLSERLYPSLSGGEKQRVHLARVLVQLDSAQEKKILMLDEPTSALDLAHQHNTLKIAHNLAKKSSTAVVIVLHDLNLAAQYADRLIVLHQGKITCDSSPWQALNPQMIEEVYGYKSIVNAHPTLGFPVVYPAQ
ncbi:heme ABC transporter ATP-binding protein [Vibrio caribbeanicus]|uniref:heme ABC transporter ATP-binding protein n=1 Tax=Vibrio caribbeanicus TaxID=701175 RepID=UPI0022849C29|nr:heme ABC transporter ATP-binding protein [Vibrio caribbeanicus]MCY9844060.1 heme ABC transporter ATP-binding protein [Vibrio caribbeanicus]